jgi:hypothetical protein
MNPRSVAVVGAAETTDLGVIPGMSQIQLHADAALNTLEGRRLEPSDIDGHRHGRRDADHVAHYLGSHADLGRRHRRRRLLVMIHVRHAAGRHQRRPCARPCSHPRRERQVARGSFARPPFPASLAGQFEGALRRHGPADHVHGPVLRYMKTFRITEEQIAMVAVVQREWAAKNPRATFKEPITVADVLKSRMIAYPFRILMCCLVTDGGGALILTSAERAKDFPQKPVYILGTGESVESPMISQMEDFTSSRAFRVSGKKAFDEAGIRHKDVDHLMIYDAFAHLPLYGLEDLGFCKPGEAAAFIGARNTAPGGKLPLNTNGGGLSYMHSGMYGMYALQESVRQMRGTAAAQVQGGKISIAHGVGGMFAASGTIVFSNERG